MERGLQPYRQAAPAAELSATVSLPRHSFASVCVMLKNDKLTSGCIPTDKKLSQRDQVSAHGRYTTFRRKMSGVVLVVKTNIVPCEGGEIIRQMVISATEPAT